MDKATALSWFNQGRSDKGRDASRLAQVPEGEPRRYFLAGREAMIGGPAFQQVYAARPVPARAGPRDDDLDESPDDPATDEASDDEADLDDADDDDADLDEADDDEAEYDEADER